MRDYARANTCTMWEAAGASIQRARRAQPAQSLHAFMLLIEQLAADARPAAARAGRSRHQCQRARRALPAGEGRPGRSARREPERARERGARLRAGQPKREADAARELPRARGAGVRRRAGRRVGGLRADDDAALREGPGVSGRVPVRAWRTGCSRTRARSPTSTARGRAPPLLRRHDARDAAAVPDVCRERRLHGVDSYGTPSRFIREIPAELLEEVRPRIQVSRPVYMPRAAGAVRGRCGAGRRAARPARAPRQVRRRRDTESAGPGEPRPGGGQLRAPGHEVADAGVRQSRADIRRYE